MTYNNIKEEFSFLDDTDLEVKSIQHNPDTFEIYLLNKIQQLQYFLNEYQQYKKTIKKIENNN
jgi:hypothetical protein